MAYAGGRWSDNIDLEYRYTAGICGERFLRELKQHARIMATRCSKCRLTYLPPRLYCEICFSRLEEWVKVNSEGTLYSYTIITFEKKGRRRNPLIYGLIKFAGVKGGLVAEVDRINDHMSLEDLRIGMKVIVQITNGSIHIGLQKE
jgi:uncharacterized OB-fold protein